MGLAAIIIQEEHIIPSVKKDLASLILRLFRVERYLYVTKKLAPLITEEINTRRMAETPISTFPIAVKRVLEEKGVIIAHPGKRSLALRSIAQKIPFSLT